MWMVKLLKTVSNDGETIEGSKGVGKDRKTIEDSEGSKT